MDYSDLRQLWTFCYSREDTYIKIIAAILDSASHLGRLYKKLLRHFLTRPAIGAFTLLTINFKDIFAILHHNYCRKYV